MTYLLVAGLAFLIVALGWTFFFWGQPRRLSTPFLTFIIVDAVNLSFLLFRHAFSKATVRAGTLVLGIAMIGTAGWALTDLWRNGRITSS